jgi:hypothetical protein
LKTTSEKLFHLADWIETNVTKKQFDFSTFGAYKRRGHFSHVYSNCIKPKLDCNTVACAAGWADEAFKKQRLHCWAKVNGDYEFSEVKFESFLGLDPEYKKRPGETPFRGYTDFDRLFLNRDDRMGNASMKQVLKRIRACAKHYRSMGR